MTIGDRDRRALTILGAALVVGAVAYWITTPTRTEAKLVVQTEPVERTEKRLAQLRAVAATVPAKEEILKRATAELSVREKGLINSDTQPQAQAQLLQILRKVAHGQTPPLELGQIELGQARPFGTAYGEVTVSVTMNCSIDQLVNMMADLTAQPEALATEDVRIGGAHPKEKTLPVRLTVSAVVPRRLVPDKKGLPL